jgi:Sodium:dicarboxylate symporter family
MQSESKRAGGKPSKWYFNLTTQVLVAMLLGALAGWLFPQIGAALKPFAELFIKMVKMVIGPLVFLMVVDREARSRLHWKPRPCRRGTREIPCVVRGRPHVAP